MVRGAVIAVLLGLVVAGCAGDDQPAPPPTVASALASSTTVAAPTTTVAKVPTLSAAPIPGLSAGALHGSLEKIGFAKASAVGEAGFVTSTSTRKDATVSTYGTGSADVVKVIAQADKAAASAVLVAVATRAVKGGDARRSETWVKAQLKKGPLSPTQPRTAAATYGRQPYELLVTGSTATPEHRPPHPVATTAGRASRSRCT